MEILEDRGEVVTGMGVGEEAGSRNVGLQKLNLDRVDRLLKSL